MNFMFVSNVVGKHVVSSLDTSSSNNGTKNLDEDLKSDATNDMDLLEEKVDSTSIKSTHSLKGPVKPYLPRRVVGIWMAQSVEYLVSILAVLKVDGIFMPMDPSWPVGRVQAVLQSAKPAILLGCRHTFLSSQNSLQAKISVLEAAECQLLWIPEGFVKTATKETLYKVERVCATRQENFCYILHTSGSSGTPKGVCGTEEGII